MLISKNTRGYIVKKIFLYAYDKVNLGDDLFIVNLVNRYPNIRFYMLSDKVNKKNFSDLRNLKIVNTNNILLKKIKSIWNGGYSRYEAFLKKRCDALVYIGGSIFIEYASWSNIVNWWDYQASNYKLYIIGANFGPYHTNEYKNAMGKVFDKVCDICFRDKNSYNLFKQSSKIRFAPDIIFSQTLKEKKSLKKIFVSVINCQDKNEGYHSLKQYNNDYVKSLLCILNEYLKDDYDITICSFCKYEGDEEIVNKLVQRLNNPKVTPLFYNGKNREDILNEINESCYIIGTRFHSIILGMVAKKPVFPIIYSNKTRCMLFDLGFQGKYIDIEKIEQLDYALSKQNLIDQYIVDIDDYRIESLEHFKILDKL